MARQCNDFTDSEIQIIREYWPTLMPINELLALIPRHTQSSIGTFANKVLHLKRMRRPREKAKMMRVVALIHERKLISPNEIAEVMGDWRQSVDHYIKVAKAAGLIHIGGFAPCPYRAHRTIKLYAPGPGEDAPRPRPSASFTTSAVTVRRIQDSREHVVEKAAFSVHRDPMIAALFGNYVPEPA